MGVTTHRFETDDGAFDITVLHTGTVTRCVVFAAGHGGNPMRHLGLLQDFAGKGFLVVAPHFEMLASPVPTKVELTERGRRVALAMARYCPPDLPICGVGHSIGTVVLLVLAGATGSTLAGDELLFTAERRFDRLVLFTPPTDFFRRPGALTSVTVPIQVWAGSQDRITPPAQARFLKDALKDQAPVNLHVVEEAGHFTFMDELPPNTPDPHPARVDFLRLLATDTGRFLAGYGAGPQE